MEERYVSQVFYILFFTDFVINMDIGILPACSIKIMSDLNLNYEEFGALGSIVFVGQTIGCISSSYLLRRMNEKILLPAVLVFNIVTLIWFT